MRVPVFKGNGVLDYEERAIPQPQSPHDVLVKIDACGICGTDLNILAVPPAHKANPGIVIGHEGIGDIIEATCLSTKLEEEADETLYWLELLVEAKIIPYSLLADLMKEADEIVAIVVSSLKTQRSQSPQTKGRYPGNPPIPSNS